jgi:enterochelin esterase-like enzyme
MNGRKALIDSMPRWTTPVVEESLATFLFLSDSVRSVAVAGDFNGWNPEADSLRRIPGTGLFVGSRSFEPDARLDYKLVLDGRDWILDPWNPSACTGGFGPNSVLAMPRAARPVEFENPPGVQAGRLDTLSFRSAVLANERRIVVYLPPSYGRDQDAVYPTLFVNDGREYLELGRMAEVLDFLIRSARMREIVAVFADPADRNREYRADPEFERMIALELVPWIGRRYRTADDGRKRGILGASLGGLTALDCLVSYPGIFGLAASQSGAFWIDDAAAERRIGSADWTGKRVYLDWGTYEPEIVPIHNRLRDKLKARGAEVAAVQCHEGHSWGSWSSRIDDALEFLFPLDDR